jgi:hypothetical protein
MIDIQLVITMVGFTLFGFLIGLIVGDWKRRKLMLSWSDKKIKEERLLEKL